MKIRTVQLLLSPILFPVAVLYGLISRLRNLLFDAKILKSVSFEPFVICVGNLKAGGAGKTPFVKFLIESLVNEYSLATLSRGYKRTTKGFLMASKSTLATEIGDEPMMYYTSYSDVVAVAVGEDRVIAIPNILQQKPDTKIVIMDDAFQHRYVKPDYAILVADYNYLFTSDYMLPLGMLREPRSGAKRADVIVVSKCPADLKSAEKERIELEIRNYCKPSTVIYFTTIVEENEVGESIDSRPVIVFSGIAQNDQFEFQLTQKYEVVDSLFYPDHHWYTVQDIECLRALYEIHKENNPVIVTTEKDFVRLQTKELKDALEGLPLCFVPIKVKFMEGETTFLESLKNKISEK